MPALGAPTLKRIAHRALTKYIRSLHSIGDTPISLVRTIINKIDNPTQLRTLELNSPQTVGHTLEAWLNLLKRDIPNYEARLPENYRETIFAVENADKWHRVYKKLKRQVERETQEQNDRLRDTLRGVETKEPMRIAAKSTDPRAGNRQRKGWAEARYDLNKDLYHSGPGKASKGTSFFEKLNRNAVTKSSARMRTPTHKLGPVFNKEVKRAPMGLVEDLKERREIMAQQRRLQVEKERLKREGGAVPRGAGARGAGVAPPLHGPNAARANGGQPYDMIKDREARLRNLKTGGGTQASPEKTKPLSEQEIARLTEDFLEDDDDDMDEADNDDLFGGSTSKSKAPVRAHSPIARHGSPLKQAQRADTPPVLKKTRHPPTLFRPAVRK
ncbi:hypothetical protein PMZ80_007213 [Knufia obscura]|uniref:Elongin-A n=1 Tax=Knufia obscura TaxID=1635080 RepID=A0ABR0RJL5_9EURO|nr:hypothetical protein PMZ80_007213 [Knufia obscura]